jgi:hypothetical protein
VPGAKARLREENRQQGRILRGFSQQRLPQLL